MTKEKKRSRAKKVETSQIKPETSRKVELVVPSKVQKFRCLPFLLGLLLAFILSIFVPFATYVLAALSLVGNLVWYVSGGVFLGLLFVLFISALLLRKAASSFSVGILFGLAFSLVIMLVVAMALLLVLVWVGKTTSLGK